MTALTSGRQTARRLIDRLSLPVAAAKLLYEGALVCMDAAGNATPGAVATTLQGIGRCESRADNSLGIAGAISADVRLGTFLWNNSAGGDAIAEINIGQVCYVVDDNTVALTDGGGTRSRAGIIRDVVSGGVWVEMGLPRGLGKVYLNVRVDDLVGADGKIYGVVSPVPGTITNIWASLEAHVLTTANAVLTGKIGATAITSGVVTLLFAGTAIGNVYNAAPTAANVVVAGSRVNFTVSGTQDNAAAQAMVTIEITL